MLVDYHVLRVYLRCSLLPLLSNVNKFGCCMLENWPICHSIAQGMYLHFDGLMQRKCNSIANSTTWRRLCIQPSNGICFTFITKLSVWCIVIVKISHWQGWLRFCPPPQYTKHASRYMVTHYKDKTVMKRSWALIIFVMGPLALYIYIYIYIYKLLHIYFASATNHRLMWAYIVAKNL